MAASPTITIFNANFLPVQMQVNNGAQFSVAAAAPPGWAPQSPASGGPTWSNTTVGQNVIAPGLNTFTVTPSGTVTPFNVSVTIPGNAQWDSLQIYIFFNNYSSVSLIVLNGGQYVTGNLQLSAKQPALDAS